MKGERNECTCVCVYDGGIKKITHYNNGHRYSGGEVPE